MNLCGMPPDIHPPEDLVSQTTSDVMGSYFGPSSREGRGFQMLEFRLKHDSHHNHAPGTPWSPLVTYGNLLATFSLKKNQELAELGEKRT